MFKPTQENKKNGRYIPPHQRNSGNPVVPDNVDNVYLSPNRRSNFQYKNPKIAPNKSAYRSPNAQAIHDAITLFISKSLTGHETEDETHILINAIQAAKPDDLLEKSRRHTRSNEKGESFNESRTLLHDIFFLVYVFYENECALEAYELSKKSDQNRVFTEGKKAQRFLERASRVAQIPIEDRDNHTVIKKKMITIAQEISKNRPNIRGSITEENMKIPLSSFQKEFVKIASSLFHDPDIKNATRPLKNQVNKTILKLLTIVFDNINHESMIELLKEQDVQDYALPITDVLQTSHEIVAYFLAKLKEHYLPSSNNNLASYPDAQLLYRQYGLASNHTYRRAIENHNDAVLTLYQDFLQLNFSPDAYQSIFDIDETQSNPIHYAVMNRNQNVLEKHVAFQRKVDPTRYYQQLLAANQAGYTPLHNTLRHGSFDTVKSYFATLDKELEENKISKEDYIKLLFARTQDNMSTLHCALDNKDSRISQYFTDKLKELMPKLNFNPQQFQSLTLEPNYEGYTPLHQAANAKNYKHLSNYLELLGDAIQQKIVSKENLEQLYYAQTKNRFNVFHHAAYQGNIENLKSLIQTLTKFIPNRAVQITLHLINQRTVSCKIPMNTSNTKKEEGQACNLLLNIIRSNLTPSSPVNKLLELLPPLNASANTESLFSSGHSFFTANTELVSPNQSQHANVEEHTDSNTP